MSEFFKSEIVREELDEIHRMQEEIYGKMMNIGGLSREDRIDHIDKLKTLLEKQRIMYTRLSLSDDPQAIKLLEQLRQSVQLMGFPPGTDLQVLFDGMKNTIEAMKNQVDWLTNLCYNPIKSNESNLSEVSNYVFRRLKKAI